MRSAKFIYIMISILLLVACNENDSMNVVEEGVRSENMESGGADQLEAETVLIPSTIEEWTEVLQEDDWYRELIANEEPSFAEFIDFNEDGLYEVILGFGSTEGDARIYVGGYLPEEKKWQSIYFEKLSPESLIAFPFYEGKWRNGEETMAIFSFMTPGASSSLENIRILRMNEENQIITAFSHENPGYINGSYELKEEEKQLIVLDEYGIGDILTLKDDHLVADDGSRYRLFTGNPITKNQEWLALLNNTFFDYEIYFGSSIKEALAKNSDVVDEGGYGGSYRFMFDDYSLLQDYWGHEYDKDSVVNMVILHNLNHVTVAEIETLLGVTIDIWDQVDGLIGHGFDFEYEGYYYWGVVDEQSKKAPVVEMTIR